MRSQWTAVFAAILTSEKLADLPDDECRLFYTWLVVAARPWGVLPARPRKLSAKVWPILDRSPDATERCLIELVRAGMVTLHEDEDREPYLYVPDWEDKAGTVGARPSRRGKPAFPIPSGAKSGLSPELLQTKSGVTPRVSVSDSVSDSVRRGGPEGVFSMHPALADQLPLLRAYAEARREAGMGYSSKAADLDCLDLEREPAHIREAALRIAAAGDGERPWKRVSYGIEAARTRNGSASNTGAPGASESVWSEETKKAMIQMLAEEEAQRAKEDPK